MKLSKIVAGLVVSGALGAAAVGAGAASADPKWPSPPWPDPGPGVNVGAPGNPLPPGQNGFPPPGHRDDFVVPVWAPPAPPPPYWAPWLPVEWNADFNAWGVWWNGGFRTAPF
jgi:hypothetical protein